MRSLLFFLALAGCGSSATPTDGGTDAASEAALDAGASQVAASPSSACGSSGLYVATSARALACGSPLSTQLVKPYVQIRLAGNTAGTYAIAPDCGQGGMVAEASDDDDQGTHDAVSGTVTIGAVSSSAVSGSFDANFGAVHLAQSFDAAFCP